MLSAPQDPSLVDLSAAALVKECLTPVADRLIQGLQTLERIGAIGSGAFEVFEQSGVSLAKSRLRCLFEFLREESTYQWVRIQRASNDGGFPTLRSP